MTLYLASIPRCGSTYLLRSICGLPQGGDTPDGAQERYGIAKTHRPPYEDERVQWRDGDAAVFLFGDVPAAVLSTVYYRMTREHFENCGADFDQDENVFDADLLGYERIWDAWRHAPFPVLFVRYEMLTHPAARRAIAGWVGRDIDWLPWRKRRTVVPESLRERLAAPYKWLIAKAGMAEPLFVGGTVGA